MRLCFIILSISFLPIVYCSKSNSTCYYPSGRIAENDTPCHSQADNSACCPRDSVCLGNSYCFDPLGRMMRSGCTDSTWSDISCPHFCRDGEYLLFHFMAFFPFIKLFLFFLFLFVEALLKRLRNLLSSKAGSLFELDAKCCVMNNSEFRRYHTLDAGS